MRAQERGREGERERKSMHLSLYLCTYLYMALSIYHLSLSAYLSIHLGSYLVAQWVKNLVLPQQWHRSQLWGGGAQSLAWELPQVTGAAKIKIISIHLTMY